MIRRISCSSAAEHLRELIRSLRPVLTESPLDLMQRSHKSMSMIWMSLLHEVLPQDLVKYGLIPELVGRLPVTVSLDLLDKEALIRILTEPKSAIVKQYQKLLELDGVKLEFDRDALTAIAETTLKRKTGARGLRAIMENIMMDTMFRVPSDETIKRVPYYEGDSAGNR